MILLVLACTATPPTQAPPPGAPTGADAPQEMGPQVEPGLRLSSIVGTSGIGQGLLGSGWTPTGDALAEGVMLRFEQPTAAQRLSLESCADPVVLELFVNGDAAGELSVTEAGAQLSLQGQEVKSLFVKVTGAGDRVCLKGLKLFDADQDLRVGPPRSVAGSVSASSTLSPAQAYHASYLVDGRADFGWVEGAQGLGLGETLTLSLERETRVQALEIYNGYQRSADHFAKNGRVAVLGLSVDGGPVLKLKLKDAQGAQIVELPEPVSGQRFELSILEAVAGSAYPDVVLSELRLVDQAGSLRVQVSQEQRAEALRAQLKGSPLGAALDRRWVGYCQDLEERELKLRSDYSFVYYSNGTTWELMDEQEQLVVFEGAWVPKDASPGDKSAQVTLFGRKHRVASSWVPYESARVSDTTRVAGGSFEWIPASTMDPAGFDAQVKDFANRAVEDRVACVVDQSSAAAKGAVFVVGTGVMDLMVPG